MNGFTETRPAAVAGQFYPGSPARLAATVAGCLRSPQNPPAGRVRALVVPHAGYQYSGETAGAAYALLRGRTDLRRAVVIAPTHRVGFRGVAVPDYARFETPLGVVPVDVEGCQSLLAADSRFVQRNDAHAEEHSLEVHLPFLQSVLGDFRLVPLVCGRLSRADLGEAAETLRRLLWRDDTLWVVSSDFTHYGDAFDYVPFRRDVATNLEQLDMGAVRLIEAGDTDGFADYVERTGATICGATPITLLLAALSGVRPPCAIRLLAYTTSGKLTHDYSHSVSYAALTVTDCPAAEAGPAAAAGDARLTADDRRFLLGLARDTIRAHLRGERLPAPDEAALSPALRENGACFVSLHVAGNLRGCIGTLDAETPLWRAVIEYAENAAFHDSRFNPLTEAELGRVEIEISALTPPRPIVSVEEFEVGRHGIILEKSWHHAVFLPQVAPEQGWDRETTLSHLARKAGLGPADWRRGARFSVFEAEVFAESRLFPESRECSVFGVQCSVSLRGRENSPET